MEKVRLIIKKIFRKIWNRKSGGSPGRDDFPRWSLVSLAGMFKKTPEIRLWAEEEESRGRNWWFCNNWRCQKPVDASTVGCRCDGPAAGRRSLADGRQPTVVGRVSPTDSRRRNYGRRYKFLIWHADRCTQRFFQKPFFNFRFFKQQSSPILKKINKRGIRSCGS